MNHLDNKEINKIIHMQFDFNIVKAKDIEHYFKTIKSILPKDVELIASPFNIQIEGRKILIAKEELTKNYGLANEFAIELEKIGIKLEIIN